MNFQWFHTKMTRVFGKVCNVEILISEAASDQNVVANFVVRFLNIFHIQQF